jgi:hypothetical protein
VLEPRLVTADVTPDSATPRIFSFAPCSRILMLYAPGFGLHFSVQADLTRWYCTQHPWLLQDEQ